MIIVRIKSGLGNQLFQYAAGRRLAYINNVRLKIDIDSFSRNPLRSYELHHFNIQADIASKDEVDLSAKNNPIRNLNRTRLWVKEKHYHFDPNILDLRGDIYLEGHMQSEKYFKDIEQIIRDELVLNSPPDSPNQEMIDRILSTESISLHIRRGDYVSNSSVFKVHGILPLKYYYSAIEHITQAVKNPHFYIFSDDPIWTQTNIKLTYPYDFVDINSINKPHEDLRLMIICKHHIIANSTLSWWGAWLCQHPSKIIYAPKSWFRKPDIDTSDLIPASWFRI